MVKSELIKQLHQKHPKLNRTYIDAIVNMFFDTITNSLAKHKPVELRDFGRFSVKTIGARPNARNPRTWRSSIYQKRKKFSLKCQNI